MNRKRILLIDAYNCYLRSFFIVPIQNDDGEHFGAVFGFLRSLKAVIDKFKPTEVIVVWDGPESAVKRRMKLKSYKANRTRVWKRGGIKAFDFLSETEQQENFSYQLKRIHEYLSMFPIKTIMIPKMLCPS